MKLIPKAKLLKNLATQGFLEKRKNRNYDTYCIIIAVLIWYARGDSNPYTEVMVPKTIVYTNFTTGAYQNKVDYTAKK